MSIVKIQQELKAPKNQRNNFGNYNYRSAEDIIEAVKPIAHKYGFSLNISDDIVEVGGRIYVKATARLVPKDEAYGAGSSSTGWAREEESKKGMDGAQITGAASSYARKYALNGLLAIDDTKDADATNTHDKETPVVKKVAVKLPELVEGTDIFLVVQKAMQEGQTTIERLKTKYILSKDVEAKLTAK